MKFLSFIVPIFAWNVPLVSLIFLKRSLVFPILLFSSISLHWSLKKTFLSLLAILWNSAFRCFYLSFSPLLFTSLLFTAICKLRQQLKERSLCDMWLKRKIIRCKYMELDSETTDWRKKPNNKLKALGNNSLRNVCKHHNVTNISIYKNEKYSNWCRQIISWRFLNIK